MTLVDFDPYAFFIRRPANFSAPLHRKPHHSSNAKTCSGDDDMDLLYVGLIIGFVAVSGGLTFYFERLRRPQ